MSNRKQNTALIGYTGFVGKNLLNQFKFKDLYNSKNIREIKGREYDIVFCAGAPAAKWLANKSPTEDLQNISILIDALRETKANILVLISTVDVYAQSINVDEDTTIDLTNHHPYGVHRRILETFVSEKFKRHHIIRLPGIFGDGLKKNVIYDFMNNNDTHKINSEAIFQFYSLDNIYADISKVINNNIQLINFATEPLSVKEIVEKAFGLIFDNIISKKYPVYNMHTKYASIFKKSGSYIQSKDEVLANIIQFVRRDKLI